MYIVFISELQKRKSAYHYNNLQEIFFFFDIITPRTITYNSINKIR